MASFRSVRRSLGVAALTPIALSSVARAQAAASATTQPPAAAATKPTLSPAEIRKLAQTQLAISVAHDTLDHRLAAVKNKKIEAQSAERDQLQTQLADILKKNGFTEAQFQQQRFLVSTNLEMRGQFDKVMSELTGQPLPGLAPAPAPVAARPAQPAIAIPAGAAGVHIGHVAVKFFTTPDSAGLLPVAFTEARVAIQHAGFAARPNTSLAQMQLHAGHIINALDPTIVAAGPGKGFGVKKAANFIATHIELAAKADGASKNIQTHAAHMAMAARSTVARSDQIIALAQQVQIATDQAAAAKLVGQIQSLCNELVAGVDMNADGKIGWDAGEGGLQQVQDHLNLMLAGERK